MKNTVDLHVSNEQLSLPEHAKQSGPVRKMMLVTSMALMSILSACGSKPDALDICVGEKTAKSLKHKMNEGKEECHERVVDYLDADAQDRLRLKEDAIYACNNYSRELMNTESVIKASQELARVKREWSKRDKCKTALKTTRDSGKTLAEGDMKNLLED